MSHVDRILKKEEDVLKRFKDREYAYREFIHKPVHIGQGILEQINSSYSKDTDGEEYEIIEIRGPKASGFFYSKNYGVFDSLRFFIHFCEAQTFTS